MFARCTSPTQSDVLSLSKEGICWSLSVTMQAWDRVNAGIHSKSDRHYPLEKTAEAHRYVDNGHKKGIVVITAEQNRQT